MSLQIQQSAKRRKKETWWDWAVWIDGPTNELDRVREVEYRLHSSFPQPLQRITSRPTKFRLESSGWGEFLIRARLTLDDQSEIQLERWLQLSGEQGPARTTKSSGATGKSVFISHSTADADIARRLVSRLREKGIEAFEPNQLPPNVPWEHALQRWLKVADLMIIVVSGRASAWLDQELDSFRPTGKPLLVVNFLGPNWNVPPGLQTSEAVFIKPDENPDTITDQIADRVGSMLRTATAQ